jgi:hypothetical protein
MNVNMHEHPLAPGVQGNENAWFAAELLLTHVHEDFQGDSKEQVVALGGVVLEELC